METYNSHERGGFYLSKLAGGVDFDYRLHNLDRITYHGPKDLYQKLQSDAYVPDHFRYRTSGETLTPRHGGRSADAA